MNARGRAGDCADKDLPVYFLFDTTRQDCRRDRCRNLQLFEKPYSAPSLRPPINVLTYLIELLMRVQLSRLSPRTTRPSAALGAAWRVPRPTRGHRAREFFRSRAREHSVSKELTRSGSRDPRLTRARVISSSATPQDISIQRQGMAYRFRSNPASERQLLLHVYQSIPTDQALPLRSIAMGFAGLSGDESGAAASL